MTNTMEGFLDNIAAVVTTDSETMQQMVTSLATLTLTNTQQSATIAAQQKTIANLTQKQLLAKPNTYPSGAHPGYETGNTGYCWAHGYKLRKGHTGATCKSHDFEGKDKKRKATRANTMGGSSDNKGFDD